jgi:hypothetical protein
VRRLPPARPHADSGRAQGNTTTRHGRGAEDPAIKISRAGVRAPSIPRALAFGSAAALTFGAQNDVAKLAHELDPVEDAKE